MQDFLNELGTIIQNTPARLRAITDPETPAPTDPAGWTRKEMLGHLIDSASNNHLRFVRTQLVNNARFNGYEQEEWVKLQHYNSEEWENLIILWESHNRHLLHLVPAIKATSLDNLCQIEENPPMTLRELIYDYLHHLKIHLGQLGVL